MGNVKLNEKPTAEDFAYAYVETSDGAIVRVPKKNIFALGKDGGYYKPTVDDDGNLTWVASAEGMPEVAGTNIKGPKGDKGDPGSDATVTAVNIKSALGYTPADTKEVSKLSQEIVDLPNNTELVEKVAEKVPYVKVAEQPTFVNSIEEMTDTSKMYVLKSDGMFYAYKTRTVTTEGSKTPNFTNIPAEVRTGSRYSHSGQAWKDYATGDSLIVPVSLKAGTNVIHVRGASDESGYNYCYFGTANTAFTLALASTEAVDANGDLTHTFNLSSAMTGYVTFVVAKGVDVNSLIATLNEEITYTTTQGGTQTITEWSSTGISYNQPADYENRVIANERNIEDLRNETDGLESRLNSININSNGTTVFSTPAYAPVPQLPADGSATADFHAGDITTQQAYDYMDALAEKYKSYVVKQNVGKDESGDFDFNRYILNKAYWRAWLKPNYPKMFAWKNGSTVIYSVSVSPRVGDTMYSTPYIGTVYNTVSAVNSTTAGVASTRTVNGLVFARYEAGDVAPTIVYTKSPVSQTDMDSGKVYDSSFASLTTVSNYTKEAITCADGITYSRYPFEDRKSDKSKPLSIFILANEHGNNGDSKVPSICLMRMAKDLCMNTENPFLKWLKENTIITMIPVGNPWGYCHIPTGSEALNRGYYNVNGVNINRNYDTPGWATSDTNYGDAETFGTYAGSEAETQHIMNTIQLCEANVGLSMHGINLSPYATEPTEYITGLMWQGCGFDASRMLPIAETLFSDYNLMITGHTTLDQSYNNCGKSPAYIQYAGAVGGLNETTEWEAGTLDKYTPTVMEYGYTQLLLFLQTWCKEALEK